MTGRDIPTWLHDSDVWTALHPGRDPLDQMDGSVDSLPLPLSLPICESTCDDAVRMYMVMGAWCLPWNCVPKQHFLPMWLALEVSVQTGLLTTYNYYTRELGQDWVQCMCTTDDVEWFDAVRSLPQFSKTDWLRPIIAYSAVACFERGATVSSEYPLSEILGSNAFSSIYPVYEIGNVDMVKVLVRHGCILYMFRFAQYGHLDCLKYLHNESGYELTPECLNTAAQYNQFECLVYLFEHGCSVEDDLYIYAAPHLRCLTYIHEQGCYWDGQVYYHAIDHESEARSLACFRYAHEQGCPWDELACTHVTMYGFLDCLRYAHEHGCPWASRTITAAITNGHFECLVYAHQNGCPMDDDVCSVAVLHGRAKFLKYLHDNGGTGNQQICTLAAERGHINCLIFCHEHGYTWDADTCIQASANGHLDCLAYAHEHGCAWDERVCIRASTSGHLDCLRYAHEHGCPLNHSGRTTVSSDRFSYARVFPSDPVRVLKQFTQFLNVYYNNYNWGDYGCTTTVHLDCLRYAHEHGCTWDETTCNYAAHMGCVPCLQYAHEHGCPWSEATCIAATYAQQFDNTRRNECLKYAHEHGCPWSGKTSDSAVYYKSYTCLRYLHDQGCPWSETITESKVLKYLVCLNNNCNLSGGQWNGRECTLVAEYGYVQCLAYLHENGCSWNEQTYSAALKNNHTHCLAYLRDNGCPRFEVEDAAVEDTVVGDAVVEVPTQV